MTQRPTPSRTAPRVLRPRWGRGAQRGSERSGLCRHRGLDSGRICRIPDRNLRFPVASLNPMQHPNPTQSCRRRGALPRHIPWMGVLPPHRDQPAVVRARPGAGQLREGGHRGGRGVGDMGGIDGLDWGVGVLKELGHSTRVPRTAVGPPNKWNSRVIYWVLQYM